MKIFLQSSLTLIETTFNLEFGKHFAIEESVKVTRLVASTKKLRYCYYDVVQGYVGTYVHWPTYCAKPSSVN